MATTQAPDAERTRLSKKAVVDRALALADANGLDGLTIRRLAEDLGVTPMALYWHFRSKEELLAGLADQVWAEMNMQVDAGQPWSQQLQGLLESLIRVLRAHPCASQLLLETEKQSEAFLQATEVTLEVLRGAGFDPRHASEVARSALWTGIMLVMSEPGAHPGKSAEEQAEYQRQSLVRMATLPPDRYPRVIECAVPLTSCDDPEFHYRLGTELFIAGVKAIAARLSDGG
jgi:TetR/AcrR family transcriptional regulator, tetracycline repressor protein